MVNTLKTIVFLYVKFALNFKSNINYHSKNLNATQRKYTAFICVFSLIYDYMTDGEGRPPRLSTPKGALPSLQIFYFYFFVIISCKIWDFLVLEGVSCAMLTHSQLRHLFMF